MERADDKRPATHDDCGELLLEGARHLLRRGVLRDHANGRRGQWWATSDTKRSPNGAPNNQDISGENDEDASNVVPFRLYDIRSSSEHLGMVRGIALLSAIVH